MTIKTSQLQAATPPSSASTSTPSPKEFWESFLSTPLTFTAYKLALHSHLSLDTFSLELAKVLCARTSICSPGRARLTHAIARSLNIYDNIQHAHRKLTDLQKVVGKLSSTNSGLGVLSLVGVICEYYVDAAVVPIFSELAKLYGLPVDLVPSAKKWQTLTQLSVGFAEMDDFGRLVDKLTDLDRAEGSDLGHIGGEALAGLLCGMGELRRGDQKTLLAFVGEDAGWVAAVAEWLFDLKIVLRRQDDGVLYTNCREEDVQFDVRFQKPGLPCDGSPPIIQNPLRTKERT